MQAAKPVGATSGQASLASEASRDQEFFVGVGLIVSIRNCDVEALRQAIIDAGGKIFFQTVTPAPLYVFRHYQVEQILRGDISWLKEIHNRKSKERRVEK